MDRTVLVVDKIIFVSRQIFLWSLIINFLGRVLVGFPVSISFNLQTPIFYNPQFEEDPLDGDRNSSISSQYLLIQPKEFISTYLPHSLHIYSLYFHSPRSCILKFWGVLLYPSILCLYLNCRMRIINNKWHSHWFYCDHLCNKKFSLGGVKMAEE